MANSIIRQATQTPRRTLYTVGLFFFILLWVAYIGAWASSETRLSQRIQDKQSELNTIEEQIRQTGSEKTFFAYKFASEIDKNTTQWSQHISALVEVLRQVQDNSYVWSNAITLSDFTISPTSLSLKWTVSNLLLIYYTSQTNNYVSLIDRFTSLSFMENIAIKHYNKIGNLFEFTLSADINPNVMFEPIQQSTISSELRESQLIESGSNSDTSVNPQSID